MEELYVVVVFIELDQGNGVGAVFVYKFVENRIILALSEQNYVGKLCEANTLSLPIIETRILSVGILDAAPTGASLSPYCISTLLKM